MYCEIKFFIKETQISVQILKQHENIRGVTMNFYVRSIFLSITTNGEKALTKTRIHMHNELKKKKKEKHTERKGRIRQWIFYRERDRDKILFYQTKWRGAFVSQLV